MHAWLCENPTGVDAVAWKELPTPQPAAGEVLIAIKAASLNFPDLLVVQGKYQVKPTPPFVPGSEFAGVVEAVGMHFTNPSLKALLSYVVFIGVLLLRPEGLFARKTRKA